MRSIETAATYEGRSEKLEERAAHPFLTLMSQYEQSAVSLHHSVSPALKHDHTNRSAIKVIQKPEIP